ncbi:hypothetical protein D3C80_1335080 [compost metagenome]
MLAQRIDAGNTREQIGGSHHPTTAPGGVTQGHQVFLTGEVRQAIGHHKRLDVTHKGVDSRGHATNMRVDAADNQLIAPTFLQDLLQRRTVERAVAPFHQHRIVSIRCQFADHRLLLWVLVKPRPPHIIQQGTVFITLLVRLRGIKHRDALLLAVAAQSGDVLDHLFDQRAIFTPEIEEILLHVVDQQCRALWLEGPVNLVNRQFARRWQRIIVKFRDRHDLFSFGLSQLLRFQAFTQQFFIDFTDRG